jgi:hypothetical protein
MWALKTSLVFLLGLTVLALGPITDAVSGQDRSSSITAPEVTHLYPDYGPTQIALGWGFSDHGKIHILVYRDGQQVHEFFDVDNRGWLQLVCPGCDYVDDVPLPNTEYAYQVCFVGRPDERGYSVKKCSREILAKGKPIAPTAPGDVTLSISQRQVSQPGTSTLPQTRTIISARWRNTDTPGQFITLEREGRVQLDRLRVGASWTELQRISSKNATDISAVVTTERVEIGTQQGNSYRVCAVVPSLGPSGKMCSPAVSRVIEAAADQKTVIRK